HLFRSLLVCLLAIGCLADVSLAKHHKHKRHYDASEEDHHYLPPVERDPEPHYHRHKHTRERVVDHEPKRVDHYHHYDKKPEVQNRHIHYQDVNSQLRTSTILPAASGIITRRTRPNRVTYASAPNSVFHTQINVQSQDSELNSQIRPDPVVGIAPAGVQVPVGTLLPGTNTLPNCQNPVAGNPPTGCRVVDPPGGQLPTGALPPGGQLPTGADPPGGQLPTSVIPTGGQLPANGSPPGFPPGGQLPANGLPNGGQVPANALPNGQPNGGQLPTNAFPPGGQLPTNAFPAGGQLPANAQPSGFPAGGQLPTNVFPAGGQLPTNAQTNGGNGNGFPAGGQLPTNAFPGGRPLGNGNQLGVGFTVGNGNGNLNAGAQLGLPQGFSNQNLFIPAVNTQLQLGQVPLIAAPQPAVAPRPSSVLIQFDPAVGGNTNLLVANGQRLTRRRRVGRQRVRSNYQGLNVVNGNVFGQPDIQGPTNAVGNQQDTNIIDGNYYSYPIAYQRRLRLNGNSRVLLTDGDYVDDYDTTPDVGLAASTPELSYAAPESKPAHSKSDHETAASNHATEYRDDGYHYKNPRRTT
ncbi:hypothetical protein KR215_011323, partial [Drosophila sulfurigaster]